MNALRFKEVHGVNGSLRYVCRIELSDDCHNGVFYFHTFVDVKRLVFGTWKTSYRHEEEEKAEKFFTKKYPLFFIMNGRDTDGLPIYPVENGFYFLQTEGVEKCAKYLGMNVETAKDLCATDKEYFKYQLFVSPWRKEIKDAATIAIRRLEEMTGRTFVDYPIEQRRFRFTLSGDEIKTISEKIASGYYTDAKIKERTEIAEEERINKAIKDVTERYNNRKKELENDYLLDIELLKMFGKCDNVVFYQSSQKIVFNRWEFGDKWTENEVRRFAKETDWCKYKIFFGENEPIN